MADDPYSVLGVARTATDDDIRRAFRRLAKESHPDLHPGNPQAVERFKRLSSANDILADPDKRKRFDRGEIDASGEPRRGFAQGGAGGGGGGAGHPFRQPGANGPGQRFDSGSFSDVFSDIFGEFRSPRGEPARGRDVRYSLEVDFLEAVTGAKKRVTLPDGNVLDLAVPEGTTTGQVLRLRGKGLSEGPAREPGDALVEITVRAHSQFKRVGDDITIEVPITIDEAVLGAKIDVATVTGRVALTLPKGTSSGRVFRLKGKGVKAAGAGGSGSGGAGGGGGAGAGGDQLVTVRIVLPDQIDESLGYFMAQWREKHRYDPGRG